MKEKLGIASNTEKLQILILVRDFWPQSIVLNTLDIQSIQFDLQ